MRRLIVQQFTSVDGQAADPDGTTDFISDYAEKHDQSFEREALDFMDTIDTMVLGRKTYELFSNYWPNASGSDAEFADKLNALQKFVVSSTLEEAPWGDWKGATIINAEPEKAIRALKEQAGKDIVIWGSIMLATDMMQAGLVDELQLRTIPVVLGAGRPLFDDDLDSLGLNFRGATPHDEGLVLLQYEAASA
jgi:dihydrofolate reductase